MIWILALLTYVLASIFAIAGMGAAGVLIPNYISLGLGVRTAMILGLSQNSAELTVATCLNGIKKIVSWKNVAKVMIPALVFVPLGVAVNIHIPRILVLLSFSLFLLFALYRLFYPSPIRGNDRYIVPVFGMVEGFIAGLIGMDAAPIAILAFAYIYESSKDISANTAATALGVSFFTLLLYSIAFHNLAIDPILLAAVVIAGFFGGITGALLMHRINRKYVRYTIIGILILAFVEIVAKMALMRAQVNYTIWLVSMLIALFALTLFTVFFLKSKKRNRKVALP